MLGFLRPHLRGSRVVARAQLPRDRRAPSRSRCCSARRSTRSRTATATRCCRWRWRSSGAGVLRLGLSVPRRLIAGRVSLGVEYDLRNRVYRHLQSLELGFFDRQQVGQLMSRATVDLQSVRFFLGYGLIFILQNLLTILLAAAVMFVLQPSLAAITLAPVPLVILAAARYGRHSRPALQEVQQRIAELTAEAEESISGIRVVKAFAREEERHERFTHKVGRVFDQSMYSTRLRAFYNPMISFLPNLGLAAVLLVGGRQVVNGSITLGEFVTFNTYLLMLMFPMRMLGIALGMAQRAVASGNRVFELLDRAPRLEVPQHPVPLPAGGGRIRFDHVTLSYGDEPPALADVTLDVAPGETVAIVGPTGLGQDDARRRGRAPVRRDRGSGARRRRRRARAGPVGAAPFDRARARRRLPVLGDRARQHRLRAPGGDLRGGRDRGAARADPRVHRRACPTATTRSSASAA